jgi:hypothetical protein
MYQNSKMPCIYMPYAAMKHYHNDLQEIFHIGHKQIECELPRFLGLPCTKSSTHHPTSTQMYQNSKMPCIYMPYASMNTIIMIFRRYIILVTSKLSVLICRTFFSQLKKHSRPSYQYSDVPKFENAMYIHAICIHKHYHNDLQEIFHNGH